MSTTAPWPAPNPYTATLKHPTMTYSEGILAENIVGYFPGYGVEVTDRQGTVHGGLFDRIEGDWPDEVLVLKDWDVYPDPPDVARIPWANIVNIHVC